MEYNLKEKISTGECSIFYIPFNGIEEKFKNIQENLSGIGIEWNPSVTGMKIVPWTFAYSGYTHMRIILRYGKYVIDGISNGALDENINISIEDLLGNSEPWESLIIHKTKKINTTKPNIKKDLMLDYYG